MGEQWGFLVFGAFGMQDLKRAIKCPMGISCSSTLICTLKLCLVLYCFWNELFLKWKGGSKHCICPQYYKLRVILWQITYIQQHEVLLPLNYIGMTCEYFIFSSNFMRCTYLPRRLGTFPFELALPLKPRDWLKSEQLSRNHPSLGQRPAYPLLILKWLTGNSTQICAMVHRAKIQEITYFLSRHISRWLECYWISSKCHCNISTGLCSDGIWSQKCNNLE